MSWEDGDWVSASQVAEEWDVDYRRSDYLLKSMYTRKQAARRPNPEAPYRWQWKKIGG